MGRLNRLLMHAEDGAKKLKDECISIEQLLLARGELIFTTKGGRREGTSRHRRELIKDTVHCPRRQ